MAAEDESAGRLGGNAELRSKQMQTHHFPSFPAAKHSRLRMMIVLNGDFVVLQYIYLRLHIRLQLAVSQDTIFD